jgi:PKD repeat protein
MKIIAILFLLLAFALPTFAQSNHYCGQYKMEQKLIQQFPEIKNNREALEKFTNDFTADYYARKYQNNIQSDTILFVIPVVFHIMHEYGAENISKAQVLDVMRIINEYFQKTNADTSQIIPLFQPIIGDAQVEFRLAQLDPQGNCTDGITRHQTYLTNGGNELLKSIVQWPPDRYLNIWVENQSLDNFSAYAYLPGAPPLVDGIVIMDDYLGSIGSAQGNSMFSVLAHEIGHYLNLWHTWGTTNNPGVTTNCNMDDQVFDTPNCIGGVCNLNALGCNGDTANVQNMMDYCWQQMFTQGQVVRMQAALNSNISNRNNLWTPSNLQLTGTNNGYVPQQCLPVADITDKRYRICEGSSITFQNFSFGADSMSFYWQFTGGNISSSTDTNPTITYNTAGVYDVILTASNNAGSSSVTRNALIEVTPYPAITTIPFQQDFENITLPSGYWDVENTVGTAWQTTQLASVSGQQSVYIAKDSANILDPDVFYTDAFDFSNISAPVFNFKVAFAQTNGSTDNLKVFMTTNCGQTWNMRYSKSGSGLATAVDTSNNFIPSIAQWRTDNVQINAATGQSNVRFKFVFTSQGGNNIFIDDINISGTVGIADSYIKSFHLSVAPNPVIDRMILTYKLESAVEVSWSLLDLYGQLISSRSLGMQSTGYHRYEEINLPSAGMYFLKINFGKVQIVKPIVIMGTVK